MKKSIQIALAFVSPVNGKFLAEPATYTIGGEKFPCIQTNESAILHMQHEVIQECGRPLNRIYLLTSRRVLEGRIPSGENQEQDIPPTHYAFLQSQLKKHWRQPLFSRHTFDEKALVSIPYEDNIQTSNQESVSPLPAIAKECQTTVTQVVDRIEQDYRADIDDPETEVRLYVDVTGGYRYVSIELLAVIQLLEYRGVKLTSVLYSDVDNQRVEPISDILRVTTLIKGMDEFVKGGSVAAIREYFQPQGQEPLRQTLEELLGEMETFSNAVRLCRYDAIREGMKKLEVRIQKFEEEQKAFAPDEKFFFHILSRVKTEYQTLTDENAGTLEIIEWCLDKGLWQQAMTLFEAYIPTYFIEHQICCPNPAYPKYTSIIESCSKNETEPRWQSEFIKQTGHINGRTDQKTTQPPVLASAVLDAIEGEKEELERLAKARGLDWEKIQQTVEMLRTADKALAEMRQEIDRRNNKEARPGKKVSVYPSDWMSQHPALSRLLRFIYFSQGNGTQDYQSFLKKTSQKDLLQAIGGENTQNLRKLADEPMEVLLTVLQKKKNQSSSDKNKKPVSITEKWKKKEERWRAFMGHEVMTKGRNVDGVISILRQYDELRVLRNLINHAVEEKDMPEEFRGLDIISTVEERIRKCIGDIRTIG